MSSNLSDRSEKENAHNLKRFTPLRYQLKGSSGGDGITHSSQNELVNQTPGCYPYPVGDQETTTNDIEEEVKPVLPYYHNGACFHPKKLL